MKCTDRPRVKRTGPNLIAITFTDDYVRQQTIEINLSQAWAMSQEILEIVQETREAVPPIFAGILERFKRRQRRDTKDQ